MSAQIQITRLESGYYHIRGRGPCNFAQPPNWPCDLDTLREHAHPEASESFLRAAIAHAEQDGIP